MTSTEWPCANLSISDADDTQLSAATVAISTGWIAGDSLAATEAYGVTSSFDAAQGILTLTGIASIAQYREVLRSVTFTTASNDPSADRAAESRTLTVTVTDAGSDLAGTAGGSGTATVSITPLTGEPVVSVSAGSIAWTEDGAPVVLDAALTLSDTDDSQLDKAIVTVSEGFTAGDVLGLGSDPVSGVAAAYDAATGTLTLAGRASVGQYQAMLRTVTFSSTAQDPTGDGTASTRTFSITVTDANSDGAGVGQGSTSRFATVTPAADAPVISAEGFAGGLPAVTYVENATAIVVAPTLILTDSDDTRLTGARLSSPAA
jgi:hypothetical protein